LDHHHGTRSIHLARPRSQAHGIRRIRPRLSAREANASCAGASQEERERYPAEDCSANRISQLAHPALQQFPPQNSVICPSVIDRAPRHHHRDLGRGRKHRVCLQLCTICTMAGWGFDHPGYNAATMSLPPVQYVKTCDSVSIAFFRVGDAPPIVFASNIFGDAHWYRMGMPHVRRVTDRLAGSGHSAATARERLEWPRSRPDGSILLRIG